MPCYDSRDADDRTANEQAAQVLSVLLCATLTHNPSLPLTELTTQWLLLHREADQASDVYSQAKTVDARRAASAVVSAATIKMRNFITKAHTRLLTRGLLGRF